MARTRTHASSENGRHLPPAHDAITHIAATYDGGADRERGRAGGGAAGATA